MISDTPRPRFDCIRIGNYAVLSIGSRADGWQLSGIKPSSGHIACADLHSWRNDSAADSSERCHILTIEIR